MDLSYTSEEQTFRKSVKAAIAEVTATAPAPSTAACVSLQARVRGNGGAVETMIAMEELGGALLADGFLETHVIAPQLLASAADGNFKRQLSDIAKGATRFAIGWNAPGEADEHSGLVARRMADGWRLFGKRSLLAGAAAAESWIVEARLSAESSDQQSMLFVVGSDLPGITRADTPMIDGRSASDVEFNDVFVAGEQIIDVCQAGQGRIEAVLDAAITAHCAEAIGAMRTLLDETVRHTKSREQFGQQLSSFQVLQHRMVDMHLHLATAAAATLRATLSLDQPPRERAVAVSAAKVTVAGACRFVGQNAIQLHGGLGMRDDTPVTRFFRRVTAMESEYGGLDWHLVRFARAEAS